MYSKISHSLAATLMLVALLGVVTNAQRRRPAKPKPKINPNVVLPPEPPRDPRLTPPPKRTFNHDAKFETEYDRFKDVTHVRMGRLISKPKEYTVLGPFFSIGAVFNYNGQKLLAKPLSITLTFELKYFDSGRRYRDSWADDTEVIFLADGDRIINRFFHTNLRDQLEYKYEILSFAFPYQTFLLIANSKTVEVRIGNEKEVVLTDADLEALRDMASRAIP